MWRKTVLGVGFRCRRLLHTYSGHVCCIIVQAQNVVRQQLHPNDEHTLELTWLVFQLLGFHLPVILRMK